MLFVLARKNGLKSIFSPILLSERNMGIDSIYNILFTTLYLQTTKIHYNRFVFTFLNCGYGQWTMAIREQEKTVAQQEAQRVRPQNESILNNSLCIVFHLHYD